MLRVLELSFFGVRCCRRLKPVQVWRWPRHRFFGDHLQGESANCCVLEAKDEANWNDEGERRSHYCW
jgi:hypothetical protein